MKFLGGITGLIAGPPGTGKSYALGQVAEVPSVSAPLLLAPKPREVNSYKYREHDIPSEVFSDKGWLPALGRYEFGAFTRLYERVVSLYDDDVHDCVLVDPFSDVVTLASHELLGPEKAETPKDGRDPRSYYAALRYKLKNFTQTLVGLASPDLKRPKHVFVTAHTQEAKEDEEGKGSAFLGEVLPMIEGSYRREIASEFDFVGYSRVDNKTTFQAGKATTKSRYIIQIHASSDRHAKIALLPRGEAIEVEGGLPAVFELIAKA